VGILCSGFHYGGADADVHQRAGHRRTSAMGDNVYRSDGRIREDRRIKPAGLHVNTFLWVVQTPLSVAVGVTEKWRHAEC